ncbi:MAG TPA: hypothetical protein VFP72_13370, partial [Kineosporiaceae bacterium]|nr:hypothetical protein [Kineosporiaceae bacterium]
MQPSSLVFLAIIAMWAAYLLPQWVRRRDAMGQSRGRDRDSGGLRVLRPRSRRVPGPSTTPLLPQVQDPGSELDAVIRPDSPQAIARRAAAGRPDAARPPAGSGIPAGQAGSAGSAGSGEAGEAGAVAGQAAGAGPQGREARLPGTIFEGRSVSSAGRVRTSAAAAPRPAQVHATVP